MIKIRSKILKSLFLWILLLGTSTTYTFGFAFLFFKTPSKALRLDSPVRYRISSNFLGGSSNTKQAVRNAFATWETAALDFREVSSNEDGIVTHSNNICSNCLAYTRVNFNSSKIITRFTTTFNSQYNFSTNPGQGEYDIERVALHEIGHAIGLDHPNQASTVYNCSGQSGGTVTGQEVMNSTISSGPKSHTIHTDDACGRNYLYPDRTAPKTITSLAFTKLSDTSGKLTWIAPGDDGASGTASLYDLRMSIVPITKSNFSSRIALSGEPAPSPAGSSEEMTLNDLNNSQVLYFAIKTQDDALNGSGVSNNAIADLVKPSTVTNLALLNEPTPRTLKAQWTAPGDDGMSGTAASYDFRYSTSPISDQNFSSATSVPGIFPPQSGGTLETFTVNSLDPDTLYYFAIKAMDEIGNISSLSNLPSQSTPPDSDDDGISDSEESSLGTNPDASDTDEDGVTDLNEFVSVTNPVNIQSYQSHIYWADFSSRSLSGWIESGNKRGVSWKVLKGSLQAKVMGPKGQSILYAPWVFPALTNFAFSFDITYKSGAKYGGFSLWGIKVDLCPKYFRIQDRYVQNSSGISRNVKHHVLVLVRTGIPYNLCDIYLDGKPWKMNQPFEIRSKLNNKIGFISSRKIDDVVMFDNLKFWPLTQGRVAENFSTKDLAHWLKSGSNQVAWSFVNGMLQASAAVSGSLTGYFESPLWAVTGRDITFEFDMFFNGTNPVGMHYGGILLYLGSSIGWQDNMIQSYPGISANTTHRVILIIRDTTGGILSTLNIDKTTIFENELIDTASFPQNNFGFFWTNGPGYVYFDNLSAWSVPYGKIAPVLLSVGNKVTQSGQDLQFQLETLNPELDVLDYSYTSLLFPPGATLNTATGAFYWAAQDHVPGTYNVTFFVSDGDKTDQEAIQVISQ